jgi:hypothetical protein
MSSLLRFDELVWNFGSPKMAYDLRNISKDVDRGFDYGYLSGICLTFLIIIVGFS